MQQVVELIWAVNALGSTAVWAFPPLSSAHVDLRWPVLTPRALWGSPPEGVFSHLQPLLPVSPGKLDFGFLCEPIDFINVRTNFFKM